MNIRPMLVAGVLAALALGARAQVFYTVQESTDTLYTVDVASLVFTPVGALGVPTNFGDLAFDTSTGTMYLSNGWGTNPSNLYTVDINTGVATLVGSTGINGVFALVYDPLTDKLYGATSTSGTSVFAEINRSTGAGTVIGQPGNYIDGMTFVGSTGQIVGLYAGPGSLHTIDPMTGVGSLLSPGGGFVDNCGIAWSSSNDTIYSIDWSGNLFAFDVANGYARQTLQTFLGSYDGLASAGPVGPPPPTAYCTAGTTTNGCLASISGNGTPSASSGSGFTIDVTSVEGQKTGLIFYGVNGQVALAWGSGSSFLCVKAPTQRSAPQQTGGTLGGCDGTLSLDFNAFLAANPLALGQPFAAGDMVWAQGWFRDPPAPKTTSLSNGLEFTVGP